jgi:uncharacterized protein (DUF433 family)
MLHNQCPSAVQFFAPFVFFCGSTLRLTADARFQISKTPRSASSIRRLVAHGAVAYFVAMKLLERITVEPGKCGGRPCIRGLRIRVTDVLGMLAEGVPHEEILRDFPYLEPDDIKAALAYAARQSDHAVLQPA